MIEDITDYESLVAALDLVGNCKVRSKALCTALCGDAFGDAPSATVQSGYIEGDESWEGDVMEPHWWVEIDGVDWDMTTSGTVVLDPSLRQFSRTYYDDRAVDIWVAAADDAEAIAVVEPNDPLFERYH